MKYYSEEATEPLRLRFEKKVLRWPKVSARKMFGCPCYQYQATPFRSGGKVVQKWVRLPIEQMGDLDRVMRFVRKSYGSALLEA